MYLNDQWDVGDQLGMGTAGDGLAHLILRVTPPFTLAVTGKWGAGKTSLMRRAFITLGGKPISKAVPLGNNSKTEDERLYDKQLSVKGKKHDDAAESNTEMRRKDLAWAEDVYDISEQSLCVWFSPWQHQNATNPLIPLLLEIKQQFVRTAKLKEQAGSMARKGLLAGLTLMERVADAALLLKANTQATAFAGTTDAVMNAWKKGDPDAALTELTDGQRFHLQFEDAVQTVLEGLAQKNDSELDENARLVIFIDDLDRCEEAIVIQLLEAIKLYLGTSRCVFVLGLDSTAILESLRHHWPTRSEDHNREYLEKLFQATVRVPAPQIKKVEQLIQAQLHKHQFPNPEKWAETLANLIEPNPRKLKNFTNSLCAVWAMHHIKATKEDDSNVRKLILFLYLSLYHPTVWRILERQPWALQVLVSVLMGNVSEKLHLPEGYTRAEQRMMERYFSRSFSHILSHDTDEPAKSDMHRGLEMEKAVELFLERIDRKRSDEVFAKLAQETFTTGDSVEDCFLCIMPASQHETES